MKKRIFSIAMSVLLMLSLCGGAFAAGGTSSQQANSVIAPKASAYLSSYRVTLTPKANHRMAIDALVYGTSIMDKIGISVIKIDEKKNGEWSSYDTLYAIDHPEFYQYNTDQYVDTISFYGTAGLQYRVTLIVYAAKNGGSDTGTITSFTQTCN